MSQACEWCNQLMTQSATDECINPEHRTSAATLGTREAGCGCCVIVDAVALRLLIEGVA